MWRARSLTSDNLYFGDKGRRRPMPRPKVAGPHAVGDHFPTREKQPADRAAREGRMEFLPNTWYVALWAQDLSPGELVPRLLPE